MQFQHFQMTEFHIDQSNPINMMEVCTRQMLVNVQAAKAKLDPDVPKPCPLECSVFQGAMIEKQPAELGLPKQPALRV
jgi:hypothetical protein